MDEIDALAHRHAQMIHELQRRRAGAAFIAVDHNEVGIDAGFQHRLADRKDLPGMADAHLEAGRFAASKLPHIADKLHHLDRCGESAVLCRRNAVLAHGHATDLGNLHRYFRRRQHAAMPGLRALADLQLDHLDLVIGGDAGEFVRIEGSVAIAAPEIAGADFPYAVATHFPVVRTHSALARVMGETTLLRAGIECAYSIGAESAKAHRRDVEDRSRIGLGAIRPTDSDAEFLTAGGL